jgi:glycolate oxidase
MALSMRARSAATRLLQRRLGPGAVRTTAEALSAASFDSLKLPFLPEAVIFPRTKDDIGEALRLANRHLMPVTVRGRGTSLTGSAAPRRGGWVIDLLAFNRIKIDAMAGMAEVEAGARVADIQAAAERKGWFYPPDPSSKQYCTIGGNVACNAGGMHGGKYGVTRDFVLALKGFMPNGDWVEWGTPTRKYAAGFNLRDLWIGSEGMLGIVTDAVLRLIPQPAARWTLLVSFRTEADAFRAVGKLFRRRIRPAICEFLDRYSVECAERATGQTVFPGQPRRPVILLESAGSAAEVAEEKGAILEWAGEAALAFKAARSRGDAERLWAVRRKCSGAMFELGDSKLNEDVVVPLRAYPQFARFLDGLRRSSGLPIPCFGHLGDGNIHVNIMYRGADPAQRRAAEQAVEQLMAGVVKLGGAISGEHGIGLAKSPFLRVQHSPAQVAAMMAVKAALDPRGILNPGKMFEVFPVWKHKRLAITLPWDHK